MVCLKSICAGIFGKFFSVSFFPSLFWICIIFCFWPFDHLVNEIFTHFFSQKKKCQSKNLCSILFGDKKQHQHQNNSEMEGCEIPYKSFGYNSLLDFLRTSGEFDLYSTNEGMQIRARVSQNSQHIVDLVGSQNRDRRKKSTNTMPFIPRFNSNTCRNVSV